MKKLLEVLTIIILSGIVCILGYKKDIELVRTRYVYEKNKKIF